MGFLSAIGPIASIAGGLLGGKSKRQERPTQASQVGPPDWAVPQFQFGMEEARNLYDQPRKYYPHRPYAYMDPRTREGIDRAYTTAAGGGNLVSPTLDYARSVLQGDYLDPQSLARASEYAVNQFVPQSLSMAENLNRGGSGLAARQMGEGIADITSREYGRERSRMQQMAGMAPMLEQLGYQPFGTMMDMGNLLRQEAQLPIDWDRDRWEFMQEEPRQRLSDFGTMITGLMSPFRSSQQSASMYGPTTGEKVAGIGNLAGGALQQIFGRGDGFGSSFGDMDLGPTSTSMNVGDTIGNFELY